jgi:ATP-dependent helicase HepA
LKKLSKKAAEAAGRAALQAFTPGQRWLSETQSELGLGLVAEVDARLVRLLFPAAGEERSYARHNAPLWRAMFGVGDRVRDLDGRELEITALDEHNGLVTYRVRDTHGGEDALPESNLDPHLHLNRPQQKLLAGRLDKDVWFRLRQRTWQQQGEWAVSPIRGLAGARISPIPHQLYIASEVGGRWAPRVLLADEVGLGKTIEAGLILHRLLLEGRVRRVLVMVPEPLLHQWLVELLRRFNLSFSLFDQERLASTNADEGNPFEGVQRVLCSLDLLTQSPANAAAVLEADWDLLIVDEAHHLHWTPEDSGLDYDLVEALAEQIPAVLLLTATPEQFGRAGHFGRLRLLDPQRFGDYETFLAEEADYAPVAEIAARLLDGDALEPAQRERLDGLLGDSAELTKAQILSRLLDRHGTGRILFRNTRSAIPGFPERRAHAYALPAPDGYVLADAADALHPERDHEEHWTTLDPRVPWLIETLRRLYPAKVLLIASDADVVLDLRRHLAQRAGIHAAVFHEGMEIVERDRAAAFFADPDEGTQVLLCSEIGSEGRNFQFANHLVLFDLPMDPDLLEQRIGRLDRIGQTRTVEIHVPYLSGSAGDVLHRWYAEGLDAFVANCPSAAAVYERLAPKLQHALTDPAQADALVAEAAALRDRLNADLTAGRDRLLELSSHRTDVSAPLVDALLAQDRDPALFEYLCAFWDAFGVEHEPGPGGSTVLHPGRHMLHEQFPGLPDDGLTVSFDRPHALAHEDRAYLTWEHPMTRAAMDLLSNSDLGSASVLLTRDPRFKAGALLLEMLHVAECPAPPELAVGRFLPRLGLRLLLDERGRDRAKDIPSEALTGKCLTGNRKLAAALLEAKAEPIEGLLATGEILLGKAKARLQREAIKRMEEMIDAEIERLTALAAVNPAIRTDEIEYLGLQRQQLRDALTRIHLRLDAVRLVVHA